MENAPTFPTKRPILSPFTLYDQSGSKIDLNQFRQQRNLVLVFLNKITPAAESFLGELGEKITTLAEEEAVVIVVLQGDRGQANQFHKRLQMHFPVLADEDGKITASFAGDKTAIYITDRFREIFAQSHDEKVFSADEVLEWLAHINRQCPECGVSHWPA